MLLPANYPCANPRFGTVIKTRSDDGNSATWRLRERMLLIDKSNLSYRSLYMYHENKMYRLFRTGGKVEVGPIHRAWGSDDDGNSFGPWQKESECNSKENEVVFYRNHFNAPGGRQLLICDADTLLARRLFVATGSVQVGTIISFDWDLSMPDAKYFEILGEF